MRRAFLLTVLLALAAVGGFFSYRVFLVSGDLIPDRAAGAPAMRPTFLLADVDGQMHSIDEWDGKALIVNFWATWCRPCLKEIPLLNALQSEYAERGVQVIGIAIDDVDEVLRFMAEDLSIEYPVLVGGTDAIEAAEGFGIDFIGLPYTAFTDHEGRILGIHLGELKRDVALKYLSRLD
ncbi:MAG: TlpA disulfide reductase family protein [Gammaproteobacteria bacterium]